MKKLILFILFVLLPLGVESSELGDLAPLIDDVDYLEDVFLIKDMPFGAEYEDTSSYMIGDVSVSVIFPESVNGSEDWTDEEINIVKVKIIEAMDWWKNREPNAHLNFVYNFEERIPTNYEPIELNSYDKYLWVEEVMNELEYYTDDSPLILLLDYVNDQRDLKDTDWGFVVFVVDSSNDADGRFADGRFAFASSRPNGGGPYIFMTYDNSGYGIDRMNVVMAHETGHVFGAKDQYGGCACDTRSGYLYYENQNCANSCLLDEPSIMKYGINGYNLGAVDYYAGGQLGWQDSNRDGILDIVGVEPMVSLQDLFYELPYEVHESSKTKLRNKFYGESVIGVLPAVNPNYTTYSIAKIFNVQYQVVGLIDWREITNYKDIFGGAIREFRFGYFPSGCGFFNIEVKAINDYGAETSPENYARTQIKVFGCRDLYLHDPNF